MIFNSITYLVFLCFAVVLYYWLPFRLRLWMLCTASIMFYGFWRWDYVWLMVYSILLDYVCAQQIEKVASSRF